MKHILFVPLVLCSLATQAGQLSLLVNGKAYHLDRQEKYNENNWGLGLQYDFNTKGDWVPFITASGFLDSYKNPSYYAGGGAYKRFQINDTFHVDLGAVAFFMTRENFNNDQPFFGALPVLSVGTTRVAVNMTYIPKVDPKMVPLLFFQLKVGF